MLLKITKFFLFTSVFSVIIVLTSTFFPFIGGKYYFFRVCVELALIFFVFWWAFEAKPGETKEILKEAFRKPLVIAVSIFVFMILLSTVFAYDPHAAFWSNYERGEGAFQMLHYYAFFLLLILVFKKEGDWKWLMRLSLVAAALMIFYGIAAAAFWSGFVGPYVGGTGQPMAPTVLGRLFSGAARFQGSLGNPSYVAPYLLFIIFYTFYLWFYGSSLSKNKRNVLFGLLTLFFLIFFGLSGTRGAFLGFVCALIAFSLYLLVTEPRLRKLLLILMAVIIVAGTLLVALRNTPLIGKSPIERFLNFKLSDMSTRFWTWGSAWQGFKERPILGWGLENFSTVFDKYFNPNHFIPGTNSETWFDRAHSVVFDYLAETGILGFLSYIGIFVIFYSQLSRLASRLSVRERYGSGFSNLVPYTAFMFAIPIAYLVQGLVLFDVLPIYMNLFLLLSFSAYKFGNSEK